MSAAGTYRHFYDRERIYVFVRSAQWYRHIVAIHEEMFGNECAIRQTLQWPERTTKDTQHRARRAYYRRGILKGMEANILLKVVVEYTENKWGEIGRGSRDCICSQSNSGIGWLDDSRSP